MKECNKNMYEINRKGCKEKQIFVNIYIKSCRENELSLYQTTKFQI